MSDKKTDLVTPADKSEKTGDGVKKSGVIGDDENQNEFQRAHKKSHRKDKRPSDLVPTVNKFGIDGLEDNGKSKKSADTSWVPEKDWDFGAGWQAMAGTDH